MAQDTPSRKLDQYIVRFPDGMRERLKALAAENHRSLNAEIIARLQATMEMGAYVPEENVHPSDEAQASELLTVLNEIRRLRSDLKTPVVRLMGPWPPKPADDKDGER